MSNSRYDPHITRVTHSRKALSKSSFSRESMNLNSLIPEELKGESQNFISFFEKYYEWLNEEYYFTDDRNKSKNIFTSKGLYDVKNIDSYTEDQTDEIKLFFDEFAKNIPINPAVDFRIVLKNIVTLYNQKGSTESIQSFFRIIYNIAASVYYPWDDVLIASDGRWDGEKFISNKGFLSDKIHLQDSKYWQRFSYDIKTGEQEIKWRNIFEALIHPSGFIFFASFLLILVSNRRTITAIDSFINDGQNSIVFRILLQSETVYSVKHLFTEIFLNADSVGQAPGWSKTFQEFTFLNSASMEFFDDNTIENLSINNKNLNISSFITQVEQ